jgi:hypothetical protein
MHFEFSGQYKLKQLLPILLLLCSDHCLAQGEWVWANRAFKGFGSEGRTTCPDKSGNIYVAGVFIKEIITGTVDLNTTYNNDRDIFIVKYDSSGTALWGRNFGGRGHDEINSITTDIDGGVLISGYFGSDTLHLDNIMLTNPPIANTSNFFVAKLNSAGKIGWAKQAKGSGEDLSLGGSIASDKNGYIYVTGGFTSPTIEFDGITITHDSTVNTNGCYYPYSSFIIKFDRNGNAIWAETWLGSAFPPAIAINSKGEIFLTGTSNCHDQMIGGFVLKNAGAYMAKANADGIILWVKDFADKPDGNQQGFPIDSFGNSITIDTFDNVYIAGSFLDTLYLDTQTLYVSLTPGAGLMIYAAKFDENGNVIWSRAVTRGVPTGIAVNRKGQTFITGQLDFYLEATPGNFTYLEDINFGGLNLTNLKKNNEQFGAFVAQYDINGTLMWADFIDYNSSSNDISIYWDNVYVTGTILFNPYELNNRTIDFGNVKVPAQQFNFNIFYESEEMFIAKLTPCNGSVSRFIKTVSFCQGDSAILSSNSQNNYQWSTGETTATITVKSNGVYSLSALNTNRCVASIETTKVNVQPLPQPQITAESMKICEGQTEELVSTEAIAYQWSTGATTRSIQVSAPGSYKVSITDVNNCTATSMPITLSFYNHLPDITLANDCNSIYWSGDYPVTWYLNNEIMSLTKPDLKTIYPTDSGLYHIEISDLCGSKKSNVINFKPPNTNFVFLPNVITPNGDGLNEYFVLDDKLSGSTLMVVNRWGKDVFYSSKYQNNWNGDDLSPGVYYYIIDNYCFTEKIKGTLTILR